MTKQLTILPFLLFSYVGFAQNTLNYPKYSISEVYQMIAQEKSDTFTLKNANIILDTIGDRKYLIRKHSWDFLVPMSKDSIEIHKPVVFENVFSQAVFADDNYAVAFNKVIFYKAVTIKNSSIWLFHNHFKSSVSVDYDDNIHQVIKENFDSENRFAQINFKRNNFDLDPIIRTESEKQEKLRVGIRLDNCVLRGTKGSRFIDWSFRNSSSVNILNNKFLGNYYNLISFGSERGLINNNDFGDRVLRIAIEDEGIKTLEFRENKIKNTVFLSLPESIQNLQMDWNQFSSNVISSRKYDAFVTSIDKINSFSDYIQHIQNENNIKKYIDSARIVNRLYYKSEIGLIGTLNSIYKRQHDLESANASYIVLKDLETKRLQFLHKENPSFRTYFKWKVNQFLKLFSDYGTEPSKAIVFSVYVILFFALIYLFFPNSWDSHGRKRIVDRYTFFLKYMDKKAGIHEVYLDDKKAELLEFQEFKDIIDSKAKKVPKIFTATAIPLYKWAVSGTKLSASFLKRIDIMKGTWSDLPKSKRVWKSVLLVGAFLIAVVYDIFIKMLNALMLSINTFTTLGFGEIPIKGLPRYLAIIQGFIGWFMLTIFSVSLISQLLN